MWGLPTSVFVLVLLMVARFLCNTRRHSDDEYLALKVVC